MDTEKVAEAIEQAKVDYAVLHSRRNNRELRKQETAGAVADIVRDACRESGIEPESEEYEAVMIELSRHCAMEETSGRT
jgi:hypothetical protein